MVPDLPTMHLVWLRWILVNDRKISNGEAKQKAARRRPDSWGGRKWTTACGNHRAKRRLRVVRLPNGVAYRVPTRFRAAVPDFEISVEPADTALPEEYLA